jgi:hypothetical protein
MFARARRWRKWGALYAEEDVPIGNVNTWTNGQDLNVVEIAKGVQTVFHSEKMAEMEEADLA